MLIECRYGGKAIAQISIRRFQCTHSARRQVNTILFGSFNRNQNLFPQFDYSSRLHFFSTKTSGKDIAEETKEQGELLYQRSPNRLTFPRYLLRFSTLHTGYWIWYVVDFTPAVAAKGAFAVNESIGIFGLGLALFMLAGSCMYPRYLISEIRELDKGETLVKHYSLPFVKVEKVGTRYPAGALKIDGEGDQHQIVSKGKGSIANYNGHLAIKVPNQRFHLLLDPKPDEVKDEVALASLLLRGVFGKKEKKEWKRQLEEEKIIDSPDGKEEVTRQRGFAGMKRRPRSIQQLPRVPR